MTVNSQCLLKLVSQKRSTERQLKSASPPMHWKSLLFVFLQICPSSNLHAEILETTLFVSRFRFLMVGSRIFVLRVIQMFIFVLCQAGNVQIEYTISLFTPISLTNTIFYGVLHRISPATFLQFKINWRRRDLNPGPSKYQSCSDWIFTESFGKACQLFYLFSVQKC